MRLWKLALLALDGLLRTPLRVLLTCLGVAIASGALFSMVGYALGIQEQAMAPFRKLGFLNNLEVRLPQDHDSSSEISKESPTPPETGDPAPKLRLDDDALERFSSLTGVKVAYPELRMSGLTVTRDRHRRVAMGLSVPREVGFFPIVSEILAAGEFFSSSPDPEVLLGVQLAHDLGFETPQDAVGKIVAIAAAGLKAGPDQQFTLEERKFEVRVAGVFSPPPMTPFFGKDSLLLPIEIMKDVPGVAVQPALSRLEAGREFDPGSYSKVIVRVERPTDLTAVAKQIGEMGYRTRSVLDEIDEMKTFFLIMDVLLASVGTVALIVSALGIVNTLLMSVLERQKEIGIYKSIGATDGDVRVLFLTEAAFVGLAGGLGGLLLGRIVSIGLEIGVNHYARAQGVPIDLAVFAFPPWLILGTMFFSMAVSLLAGVYPASRAGRVDPIRALRGN